MTLAWFKVINGGLFFRLIYTIGYKNKKLQGMYIASWMLRINWPRILAPCLYLTALYIKYSGPEANSVSAYLI